MADLLVKLYELPDSPPVPTGSATGVRARRAMAYEKQPVVDWVRARFGSSWAGECDVAFANRPISCHLATRTGEIVGFACWDSTCRGFFGPLGVAEPFRHSGVGRLLLFSCLQAMAAAGYAYAIIGGAGSPEFYGRAVGAVEIPGSSPGIYRDRLTLKEGTA